MKTDFLPHASSSKIHCQSSVQLEPGLQLENTPNHVPENIIVHIFFIIIIISTLIQHITVFKVLCIKLINTCINKFSKTAQ